MKTQADKINLHKALYGVLLRLLLAGCFSMLIVRLSLDFSELDFLFWQQLAATTIIMIISALIAWAWQSSLVITIAAVAAAVIGWLTGYFSSDKFSDLIENASFWLVEAFYWLISQPNYFPESTKPVLAVTMGIIISIACFWLIARTTQPWLMMISVIALIIGRQSIGIETSIWLLSAGFLLILTGFSIKQTGWSRKLRKQIILIQPAIARQSIIIAIAALTSAALLTSIVPVSFIASFDKLISAGNFIEGVSIWNTISGSEQNSGIGYAGYYPLNDRLGGPVNLSNEPVLLVNSGSDPMLLKGSVSDIYTGNGWHRLPTGGEYQFDNILWRDYFRYVYDLDLPDREFLEMMHENEETGITIEEKLYEITHLINGMRSVYHVGKPFSVIIENDGLLNILPSAASDILKIQLKSDENLYFNEGGVLYRKTTIPKLNTYEINADVLTIDEIKFADWYRKAIQKQIDNTTVNPESISRSSQTDRMYLQLPELPEYQYGGEIDLLTQSIVNDFSNSYDKANAIRDYLRTTNRYSLDVEIPPENKEFVSWFLDQGEGYCVYFATALTMMCRSAGIPARYVEGYWVPPVGISEETHANETHERTITGKQAHAWSEIYLENIGWIAIDATPGGGEAAGQFAENEEQGTGTTTENVESSQTATEAGQSSASEQPPVASQPVNSGIQPKSNYKEILLIAVPVLLILALIAIWCAYKIRNYKRKCDKSWWINQAYDVSDRIQLILPEITTLLKWNKFRWPENQSWRVFANKVAEDLLIDPKWKAAAASIEESIYSNNILTEKDWLPVWDSYQNLIRITKNKKPGLYWILMLVVNS